MMKRFNAVMGLLLVLSILVVGCGGGGDSTPPPPPETSEGSATSAVSLSVTGTHPGKAGSSDLSFYEFTATSGSGVYTISVTDLTAGADVQWALYDYQQWAMALDYCDSVGTTAVCTTQPLTAGTKYSLIVSNLTTVDANYDLLVSGPIATAPAAPGGLTAIGGFNQVSLAWTGSVGATSYNIYWATTEAALDTLTGPGVTKISNVSAFTYTHASLTAGQTYYYVVTAVNAAGESLPSVKSSATTIAPPASVSLPFSTNFNDGTLGQWSATGNWGIFSCTWGTGYCATDTPATKYAVNSDTFIISPLINMSGATAPQLTFNHQRYIGVYDSFNRSQCTVEVSTNSGQTWTVLATYQNTDVNVTQPTINLTAYKDMTIMLRFRLVTGANYTYDGWYVDEILVTAN